MAEHVREHLMLASPIKLGSLELSNRIVKSSTVENMACNGEVSDRLIEFYRRQARGGAGLLIIGGAYVQSNGRTSMAQVGIASDTQIRGLQKLTDAVHDLGAKIVAQISHAGRQTRPDVVHGDVVAPSAVKDRMTGVTPRAMKDSEIMEVIDSFGSAARRVKQAGFDGIQVMAGHGYLINQFLSRRTNQRADRWGGSLERRASFLFRVLDRVKSETGGALPMLAKLNTEDHSRKGFNVEESAWVAERLAQHGVDAVELSGGTYESALNICRGALPEREILEAFTGWQWLMTKLFLRTMRNRYRFSEAYFLENAKVIKRSLHIPVILVGGLRNPQLMENLLRSSVIDLVGIGRPLIRDPNLPRKILAGDQSLPSCSNCNRCFIRIVQDKPLACCDLNRHPPITSS